ncbi:MAG: dihydropteroate synthase [Bowdeniella nasicola]|nr:dihydropteroate synthase [Bowdeniella nasicola]
MTVAVMGIVNITPDSFSDGGRYRAPSAAIARAHELIAAGATIIDIGGESTRPGSTRIDAATEIARIKPVVEELVDSPARISIDTLHARTAAEMLDLGVTIINDVSGGLADPAMYATVGRYPNAHYIMGHWRATPATMTDHANYRNVVAEVAHELAGRVHLAWAASLRNIVLDPGIGFAKNAEHNWQLLRHLPTLRARVATAVGASVTDAGQGLDVGPLPVMLGVSRKRFLAAHACPFSDDPRDRDLATAVISAHLACLRPWALRVHNVGATVAALDIAHKLNCAGRHG